LVDFFVARFAGHPEEGFFGKDEERLFASTFLDRDGFEFGDVEGARGGGEDEKQGGEKGDGFHAFFVLGFP
jgi:hypothetical protein